jgi:transposase-like protein
MAEEKTPAERAHQFEMHPSQLTIWKRQISERAADVFDNTGGTDPPADVKAMHAAIGQLTRENDFLYARSSRRDC